MKTPERVMNECEIDAHFRESDATTASLAAHLSGVFAPDPNVTGLSLLVLSAELWLEAVPDLNEALFRALAQRAFLHAMRSRGALAEART